MSLSSQLVTGSVAASLLLSSFAFAQTGAVPVTTSVKPRDAVNGACVATAVGVREDALIAAHTAQNAGVGAALTTRKSELMAAWNMTDNKARRVAREAAWKKFRDARKATNATMKTAVQGAHNAFNTAAKACGVNYKEAPEAAVSVTI